MGMNRAMRRKQIREQMHEWVNAGRMEQVRILTQQGISEKDLNDSYDKGYNNGYKDGADRTMKVIYSGIVCCLLDMGNSKDEAIGFLKAVDNRLITSIDADEDIEEVLKRTGIRLMLKEDFDRVREVAE